MSAGNARPPENEKKQNTCTIYTTALETDIVQIVFFCINENYYKNNLCYTEANDFRLFIFFDIK